MTALNPPGFLQNRSDHTARELRGMISALVNSPGIIGVNDFLVAQRAAGANMSVDIAGGQAFVLGTDDPNQGYYHCLSDSTPTNVTVTASHATLNRIDLVIARVYDSAYIGGALNQWGFEVTVGTPAASPVAPIAPADSMILAQIYVGASVVNVLNANLTNTRIQAGIYATVINAILTGTPTAPTAAPGTSTTQIATTAYVQAAQNDSLPDILMLMGG